MKVNLSDNFVKFVSKFRGSLYTLLFLSFLGLSSLNTYLNFSKPISEIRDAGPLASAFEPLEKLTFSKENVEIAETNARSSTSRLARVSSAASGSSFSIQNPTETSDSSFIDRNESGVKVYKNRFFFAHSDRAFNWIKYASEGDTFTVMRNGSTSTYKIAKKQVLSMNGNYNGKYPVASYYSSISERSQFLGKTYSISLMTCGDGTTGPNGNSSDYRTFIFAEEV